MDNLAGEGSSHPECSIRTAPLPQKAFLPFLQGTFNIFAQLHFIQNSKKESQKKICEKLLILSSTAQVCLDIGYFEVL
jgi:hypothetical protein